MLKLPERLGNMVIGYQDVFDEFNRLNSATVSNSYPPYNMIKMSAKDEYRIEIAVAGFTEDDIEITQNDRTLSISGIQKIVEDENIETIHRGIAARNFKREFVLAPHLKIKEATMKNGILTIELYKELPIELQPKRIPIST